MSDEKNGSSGAVLLGFVLGAIAGAAVALLMAPARGRETREFIGEKTREGMKKAKDVYAKATGDGLEEENA